MKTGKRFSKTWHSSTCTAATVGEGKKSAAFALTYRDAEKTLTDEEVNAVHSKVLEALRDRLGAVQREM